MRQNEGDWKWLLFRPSFPFNLLSESFIRHQNSKWLVDRTWSQGRSRQANLYLPAGLRARSTCPFWCHIRSVLDITFNQWVAIEHNTKEHTEHRTTITTGVLTTCWEYTGRLNVRIEHFRKQFYLLSGSRVVENDFLMWKLREEWADWF